MSKSICLNCEHKRYCATGIHQPQTDCVVTGCSRFEQKATQTNADRIRAMSDEELAEFFGSLPCCPPGEDIKELCYPLDSCEGTDLQKKCWLDWLKQEATE